MENENKKSLAEFFDPASQWTDFKGIFQGVFYDKDGVAYTAILEHEDKERRSQIMRIADVLYIYLFCEGGHRFQLMVNIDPKKSIEKPVE